MGRTRALALPGKGRFARAANMTGGELIRNGAATVLLISSAGLPAGVGLTKCALAIEKAIGPEQSSLFFSLFSVSMSLVALTFWLCFADKD
jgi:hypothetical protein